MEMISGFLDWLESREGLLSALAALAAILGISYGVVTFIFKQLSAASRKRKGLEDAASGKGTSDSPASRAMPGPPADLSKSSIAVLPLRTLSSNENDANIAAGLSSEINADLSQVPDIRVASHLASMGFQGRNVELREVAEVLSIRYVLTGSFQRHGDKMRLTAELTDALTGEQLWASTFDRELEDLFTVQAEVSKAIVAAIGGELKLANTKIAYDVPTQNLDAWGLVQKAYNFWLTAFGPDDYDRSLDMLREAVRIDPGYAAARASLAMILSQRVINGLSGEDEARDRKEVLEMIEEAVKLGPNDITVLENAGLVWTHHGHGIRARQALRHAVELSPLDLIAWGYLGFNLGWSGNEEEVREAVEILERLLHLAPKHPSTPYWNYFLTNALTRQGKLKEAEAAGLAALKKQPSFYVVWISLANIYGQQGRIEEARSAIENSLALNPILTASMAADRLRKIAMTDEAAEPVIAGMRAAGLLDPE